MMGCGCRTVKKADRETTFTRNTVLEENSADTLDRQEDKQVGPRANQAGNIAGGTHDDTEAVLLQAHWKKVVFFGRDTNSGGNRRQKEKRKTKYERDRLHDKNQRQESLGAGQGCRGWDIVHITGSPESEPTQ